MRRFLGISGNAISRSINGATVGKRQPRIRAASFRGWGDGCWRPQPLNAPTRATFPVLCGEPGGTTEVLTEFRGHGGRRRDLVASQIWTMAGLVLACGIGNGGASGQDTKTISGVAAFYSVDYKGRPRPARATIQKNLPAPTARCRSARACVSRTQSPVAV
jgi:hypothetical protein